MDAELYLTAYRYEQDRVDRLLERRRVVAERTGTEARRRTPAAGPAVARLTGWVTGRQAAARQAFGVAGRRAAARQATVRQAGTAGDCCAPA